MQSKRILVTGANGQLGSEMRKLGSVSPNEYIFTDVQELDITNKEAVMSFVEQNGGCTQTSKASADFPGRSPAFLPPGYPAYSRRCGGGWH